MQNSNKSTTCNLELSNCYQMENIFQPSKNGKYLSARGWQQEEESFKENYLSANERKQLQWPIRAEARTRAEGSEQTMQDEKPPVSACFQRWAFHTEIHFRFLACCSVSRYLSAVHHSLRLKFPSSRSNAVMSLCKKTVSCPQVKKVCTK